MIYHYEQLKKHDSFTPAFYTLRSVFQDSQVEKKIQIIINCPWASFHTSPHRIYTKSSHLLLAPQFLDAPSTRLAYPDMLLKYTSEFSTLHRWEAKCVQTTLHTSILSLITYDKFLCPGTKHHTHHHTPLKTQFQETMIF